MLLPLLLAVNTLFGNCTSNGTDFSYAPDSMTIGNRWVYKTALTSNDYERANWWPVTDTPPVCETNMQAHAYGWAKHDYQVPREVIDWHCRTNTSGEEEWYPVTNTVYDTKYWIERLYNQVIKPIEKPTPRKWTPLSLKRSAQKLGYWEQMKAFLNAANAYDDFIMAQYEAEDDPQFVELMKAARAQLGNEVVDAILNNAETENGYPVSYKADDGVNIVTDYGNGVRSVTMAYVWRGE